VSTAGPSCSSSSIVRQMSSVLATGPVNRVLARLYSGAEEFDAQAKRRLPISDVDTQQMADLLIDAPLAITAEVGELLDALALTKVAMHSR
jgi:hypothetical protein